MRPAEEARLAEETAARRDLLDGLAMLERVGIVDFNGHASTRLADGRILINSGASVRSRLAPEDISTIDGKGETVAGATAPIERYIHTEIYKARRDVGAIIHGHPKWSTVLTSAGMVPMPVLAQGCLLADTALVEDPMSINTPARGEMLANALGGRRAALMRAHGMVVVGSDMVEAFALAVYLELNAERQVEAARLGTPYEFSEIEIAASESGLFKRGLLRKCWDYYHAKYARNGEG